MARQVFTKAFKLEAVRLLEAGKQPAAAISRELRIKREKLYAWRNQLRERGADAFHDRPGRPAAGESAEVKRLKRELERVTEERDILKKRRRTSRASCREVRLHPWTGTRARRSNRGRSPD